MCCFFASLIIFGPRLAFLIFWLIAPLRVNTAFGTFNFPWLVGIASLVFAPWTALMYVLVFPLNGWDWIWIGLGILQMWQATSVATTIASRCQCTRKACHKSGPGIF